MAGKLTTSFIKRTDNIGKTIRQIAREYNVAPQSIDFDILRTVTELAEPEHDFVELDHEHAQRLLEDAYLMQPDLQLRQIHEINVRPRHSDEAVKLEMSISVDKFYTRAIANLKKSSVIPYTSNLTEVIIGEINKRKARNGMLINLRDKSMREAIAKLATKIRINGKLLQDYEIELTRWVEPKPTIDDKLIFHTGSDEKLDGPDEKKRVDYADRGFVQAVNAGDLICEYVKPRQGVPGRNFRGEYLEAKEPDSSHAPAFTPDAESVDVAENDRRILFSAKRNGYIQLDEKELKVGDKLEVGDISFKTTGDIKAGTDKEVKINVKGEDVTEDHIGPNTKVSASEVSVSGSIANGARIRGNTVKVDGQTHKTSKIIAGDAHINIHRGELEAKTAEISRLEYGTVTGDHVVVQQAIGGTISGKVVEVKQLKSHTTIIASHQVRIRDLEGGENKIYIQAAASKSEKKRLDKLVADREALTQERKEAEKEYKKYKEIVRLNKPQADDMKEKILRDKKLGKTPPYAFVQRYKRFLEEMKEAKTLQDKLEMVEKRLGKVLDDINVIQDAVFSAEVICDSGWINHNTLIYKLLDPPTEFTFVPKQSYRGQPLKLVRVGADEFTVKPQGEEETF